MAYISSIEAEQLGIESFLGEELPGVTKCDARECNEIIDSSHRFCMACGTYNYSFKKAEPLIIEGEEPAVCPETHFGFRLARSTQDEIKFCPDCGGNLDDTDA